MRLIRPALYEEALRLGRRLAELAPDEPEAHGLVALMEIQASRTAARLGPGGEPVLLLDQDRSRWDPLLIVRGRRALQRAEELLGPLGPYGLQAAIAACDTRALRPEETDWIKIAALYDALSQIAPSPVSSSTGRSPWAWPSIPRLGWKCWKPSPTIPPSPTTTSSPACVATCWRNSAAAPRRRPSSSAPRR